MPKFEKQEPALVKKIRSTEPLGKSFVSPDIISKAKLLMSENRNIVSKDDQSKIETLTYKKENDTTFCAHSDYRSYKSDKLKSKIRTLDESQKHILDYQKQNRKKVMPAQRIGNIDEVKMIKSKRWEIENTEENLLLHQQRIKRKQMEDLKEVKEDFVSELNNLKEVKAQQEAHAREIEQKRKAQASLTGQVNDNNMVRIKEQEEKEKEQRLLKLQYQRLLEDEEAQRRATQGQKEALRVSLDQANTLMIEHKSKLRLEDQEETNRVRQWLEDEERKHEALKREEHARKKAKEEQQRKMLEKQEAQTDFAAKLDEKRMKRYQEQMEAEENRKEQERMERARLNQLSLIEEGERQKAMKLAQLKATIELEKQQQDDQLRQDQLEFNKLKQEERRKKEEKVKNRLDIEEQMRRNQQFIDEDKQAQHKEENLMIQELVHDVNSEVADFKKKQFEQLAKNVKVKNKRVIDRIGKK